MEELEIQKQAIMASMKKVNYEIAEAQKAKGSAIYIEKLKVNFVMSYLNAIKK